MRQWRMTGVRCPSSIAARRHQGVHGLSDPLCRGLDIAVRKVGVSERHAHAGMSEQPGDHRQTAWLAMVWRLCRARDRRHTCAIHTLEATGDVRKVSLWLGHASLQTTEMYLQADPTDKLDTLHRWRPPSLKKGKFKGVQDELLAMLAGT